jgi:TM2 domain-containing membrane protein YozV
MLLNTISAINLTCVFTFIILSLVIEKANKICTSFIINGITLFVYLNSGYSLFSMKE